MAPPSGLVYRAYQALPSPVRAVPERLLRVGAEREVARQAWFSPASPQRWLLGPLNTAGQADAWARAAREAGVDALSLSVERVAVGASNLGYATDVHLSRRAQLRGMHVHRARVSGAGRWEGATGVLAVELFETTDDRLLVNELALRPHNTGHWTIDGSVTSQFEQHLRAVLDLPLGATGIRDAWSVMTNILGGPTTGTVHDRYESVLRQHPNAKIHDYGKQPRPGRKIGHVTVTGDDLDDVAYQARAAQDLFTG